jgi:probable H4MPT-linked C1 transfer pathway protein
MFPIIGWDVGGANIKAARVEDGQPQPQTLERPLALWREPHRLASVLAEVGDSLGPAPAMAVTMTAELADCFATKREGVASVLDAFETTFPGTDAWVYGTDGAFRRAAAARQQPMRVAAANWMASATVVSRICPDALFIDVGSTTTDIIPIVGGRVAARGKTDPARLRTGELVYTGLLRTPVCAVVRTLPRRGRRCRVAAEHFAIVGDAHLWLGHIDAADYTCDTPDGRGRSRLDAGARLARMVCADLEMLGARGITEIAEHIARVQVQQISRGIQQVMRRLGAACPRVAIVAGQGASVGKAAAKEAGLAPQDLAGVLGPSAARAVPAAAVACLLREEMIIKAQVPGLEIQDRRLDRDAAF